MDMDALAIDIRDTIKAHEDLNAETIETHPAIIAMFARHGTTLVDFRKEVNRLAQVKYDALPQAEKDILIALSKKEWKGLRKKLKAVGASKEQLAQVKKETLDPKQYMATDGPM